MNREGARDAKKTLNVFVLLVALDVLALLAASR